MATRFNVTERLAEGRSAVEHTQSYVWACHVLGYHHPELTLHAEQSRDLYDSEDGLDLWVLDDDCAKLRAAANATDEALSRQRALLADLAFAWRGPGAESATEFLRRHCDATETVAAAVRMAAERWAALPDELWQLIDRKVATAIAIDDRRLADRPAWLAAAQAVTSGGGDRAAAEIVGQQITPYVDNDIGLDWLGMMRSTAGSVDASFDAVIDAAAVGPAVRFELPGDFAPLLPPLPDPPVPIATAFTAPVAPMSAGDTPPAGPAGAAFEAAALPAPSDSRPPTAPPPITPADAALGVPPPAPPPWDSALGGAAGLPTGGGDAGGLGGLAGSISSVIGQIVDGIGGLLGSLTDGLADSSMTDDAALDALDADHTDGDEAHDEPPDEPDDKSDSEKHPPADDGAESETLPAPDQVSDGPTAEQPAAPTDAAPAPDPPPPNAAPTPDPPAAESVPPPPSSEPDKETPCEIAADQLPQAGQ